MGDSVKYSTFYFSNKIILLKINDSKPKINADFAIENMLKYAKEVERIVWNVCINLYKLLNFFEYWFFYENR